MSALNAARGETVLDAGGRQVRLCLTLGALAEIETALGADHLGALAPRLAKPSARDLALILSALARGGGNDLSAEDVLALGIAPGEALGAIAAAFAAAGFSGAAETQGGGGSEPGPFPSAR